MDMKKLLLGVATVSTFAVVLALSIAANGGTEYGRDVRATLGGTWYHYAAVAATTLKHGSREFWANSSNGCTTHQFSDPGEVCVEKDFSTYDSFLTLDSEDDRYLAPLAATPVLDMEHGTLTYGLFPQTTVVDADILSALSAIESPEDNGWYLYGDEYYAKVEANPYFDSYKFDNGNAIVRGTTYWFKCEPITWKVLSSSGGDYFVVSDVLLDAHRFGEEYSDLRDGHYANNYEYSEIRAWINSDFYNMAFSVGNSHIKTTTVDNGASTTPSDTNKYACENTEDKVFLLSYQELANSSYFATDEARECRTTDWARARGGYYATEEDYAYNGMYWTRSPDHRSPNGIRYGNYDGSLSWPSGGDNTYRCVRPAITLTIA